MTRAVFMGTPEFAVPSLEALASLPVEVVGVFTQPDRPVGRGHRLTACPVKLRAVDLGLSVYQFDRLRSEEGKACLRALAPDVVITAAFGQILDEALLAIPAFGTLNVHASLLPRHRGAAPINRCILEGDRVTGVTIMRTERGIDTGDMYAWAETPVGPRETAAQLTERLAELGGRLLGRTLPQILSGELQPVRQDESQATYEPMLRKEMGAVDWTRSAEEIDRQIRGLDPWPGTYTDYDAGRLKILSAIPLDREAGAAPGTVTVSGPREGLVVACGEGCLELVEIQAPNAKRMAAKAYLAGRHIDVGTVFKTVL